MALTNTFVKNIKHSIGSAVGKYRDGGGMYLQVNPSGKYWRMDYRFADKRKTLSLGVYPSISLAKARQRREKHGNNWLMALTQASLNVRKRWQRQLPLQIHLN